MNSSRPPIFFIVFACSLIFLGTALIPRAQTMGSGVESGVESGGSPDKEYGTESEGAPQKGDTIVFSSPFELSMPTYHALEKLYSTLFARLGYKYEQFHQPPERSLADADAGKVDGDTSRVGDILLATHYTNLIMVSEPVFIAKGLVFATNFHARITSWEDFGKLDARVIIVRGHKSNELNAPKHISPDRLIIAPTAENALAMLAAGRGDVLVAVRETQVYFNLPKFKDKRFETIGEVGQSPIYLFVNKRLAPLAPAISAELKRMHSQGEIEQFFTDSLVTHPPALINTRQEKHE